MMTCVSILSVIYVLEVAVLKNFQTFLGGSAVEVAESDGDEEVEGPTEESGSSFDLEGSDWLGVPFLCSESLAFLKGSVSC